MKHLYNNNTSGNESVQKLNQPKKKLKKKKAYSQADIIYIQQSAIVITSNTY